MIFQKENVTLDQSDNPSSYPEKISQKQACPKKLLQIIDQLDSFKELGTLWNSMSATLDTPIQNFDWAQIAAEHVCTNGSLRIVINQSDINSIACAPMTQCKGIFSPLKMLGVSELYEPMDFLYTEVAALDGLAKALKQLGHAICLDIIPTNSPMIPALKKAYRGFGWVHVLPISACPYIILSEDWTCPDQQFNSGRRSDFRRAQRHAERMGKVTYDILSPTPAEVDLLLTEAFQVEKQSWKGEAGSALAIDEIRGTFYRKYALLASQKGILRICFLRINGQAIAMQIAVEYASRFWLLKIGYDGNFSRCSPGNLLMLHTVKYAADKGFTSYEFLGGDEPWTKVWTDLVRPNVKVRVYPFNLSGIKNFGSDTASFLYRRFRSVLLKVSSRTEECK